MGRLLLMTLCLGLAACTSTTVSNPDLEDYYESEQQKLLARGKLRTDYSPKDASYGTDDLIRNFQKIALFDEYTVRGGQYVRRETPSALRKWDRPIRVDTLFGPSVSSEQRKTDRRNVEEFTARLARLTGQNMRMSSGLGQANFLVMFLNQSEQEQFARILQARYPNIEPAVVRAFQNSPRNIFCVAYAFASEDSPYVYTSAVILVKAEHKDLMRLSCIHEEMAQAMGLANDSREARPSIFNDDEEFALLTRHDELLLQMLYDPRLKPGMSAVEVLPLLPSVATRAGRGSGS
ncbi:DUF2927 domain-containing protein [Oceanomicrobium pacificus]|uniref:DUF2927 domain-containing protein n=1 Tax=Oceanomicrobium pacificus TaxID=2692916 RepID=A0A6B0TVZ2_9RHOB|nr:DUF2927 domain-containing protein [Oceanomicrobium pacificus]MXU65402.1 DUF2927 domain-containing protein [Oceanomicrobium pacificus]